MRPCESTGRTPRAIRRAAGAVALAALLAVSEPAAANPARDADDPLLPRVVTTVAVYGALYTTAVAAVQTTITVLQLTVPATWIPAATALGMPAVMVGVMSIAVPGVRTAVPEALASWFRPDGPDDEEDGR